MYEILGEALRAIGLLIGAGLICFAFSLSKTMTKDDDKGLYKSLLIGLAVCTVIGFISASNVGKPTCLDSDTDNRGTTCYEYADDGYEATSEERITVFVYWFIITMVPIGLGINTGFNSRVSSKKDVTK